MSSFIMCRHYLRTAQCRLSSTSISAHPNPSVRSSESVHEFRSLCFLALAAPFALRFSLETKLAKTEGIWAIDPLSLENTNGNLMLRRGIHSKDMAMLLSLKRWDMETSPCAAHYCHRMFAIRGALWLWVVCARRKTALAFVNAHAPNKALMYRSNSDSSVESAKSSDEDQEALCQLSKGLATTMQKFGENAAKRECSWRPWVVSHFSEQVKPFPLIWRTSAKWSTNWCVRMIIYTAGKHSIACIWYL